jgi:hypothetical protein
LGHRALLSNPASRKPGHVDMDRDAEPSQPTQPKKGKPVEIPVPKVSTIRAAIRKVAQSDRNAKLDD